ncbi:Coiled-coil domain-containing protein [Paragonimus heterotremus]|uniref:Coiled-coil domain-containing protein n=1 Tax=Paragonimus heterotremus TaxID=100268 RepID=A0A8J4TB98_9TREM|nr:Coiled-coil domain-containing protein [Paragonimus heterotremus]
MSRNSKHIEVSSVSLVDLKAEISRRQIEIKQKAEKLPEGCSVIKSVSSSSVEGKKSIWRKPRDHQPTSSIPEASELNSEDTQQLENIKRKLEAKAKLYEALKAAAESGTMCYSKSRIHPEEDDTPLVDFEQKVREESRVCRSPSRSDSENSCKTDDGKPYPAACSDEEWEEYTDDLGMKRTCMRKDRPNRSANEPPPRPDGPLTYAHLREGEIREHGVGFYAFSEDRETREAEMARLMELHRATEEGRARAEAIRAKRDARMGQRLARLRARKGLPDVATAAAQCLAQVSAPPTPLPVSADAQSDIRLGSEDLDVASMLRRLRDEAERRASLNNPVVSEKVPEPVDSRPANLADVIAAQNPIDRLSKSREWDRGKSMMSAQRYIQEERVKRLPEFAPPSFY